MSKEILEKAIKKAIDGGWYNDAESHTFIGNSVHFQMSEISSERKSYRDIIYDQDFARALWGEEESSYATEGGYTAVYPARREWEEPDMIPVWQYHLQQIVIADDPIKYLGENI